MKFYMLLVHNKMSPSATATALIPALQFGRINANTFLRRCITIWLIWQDGKESTFCLKT